MYISIYTSIAPIISVLKAGVFEPKKVLIPKNENWGTKKNSNSYKLKPSLAFQMVRSIKNVPDRDRYRGSKSSGIKRRCLLIVKSNILVQ